jgi:NitT/TauT family transport system substrate-binding protein
MRRREFGLGMLALPLIGRAAAAESSGVRIAKQYGLPYLPMMVMEHERLVEKHAARLGLPALEVSWPTLGGTSALTDGLLSGQLDFAGTGAPALLTLWDKTVGTAQEIRALSAIQSMPFLLVTNDAQVKTLADFSQRDRIALPAVKLSAQALTLQMAAAQLWGFDKYDRLDELTVTLPHPDALASLLAQTSAVNSHYSVAPFYYYELAAPNIHLVLKSYDTLGGKHINGTLIGAKRFRDANPKITAAVLAAQEEANALINGHPRDAAAIYLEMAGDKRSTVEEMARMVADADNEWTTTPRGVERFAEFMHKVGRMKHRPASWKDLYFPEVHALAGS